MDFLNKAIQQITELFQQMTPAARITAGLLLVAIVCSLFYLFRAQTTNADEYLFGGDAFSHRDLANMETAFAKAGVPGSQIEGNRMKVPRGKKELFLKALRDHDAMPENYISYAAKALEKDNPFSATASRNMAMKTAKERELARVVRSIKGIEDANVMYDETMSSSFPRRMERRASVAVKANGNRHLTDEEIKTVRNMVIGAVGSLRNADVTVVDLNAGRAFPGGDGTSNASDNPYAITKRMFEEFYRDKIATRLSMVPGIVVGVNVELDPEVSHSSESVEIKGRPAEVQSTTFEKSTPVVLQTAPSGRPGANPNAIGNSAQSVNNQVIAGEPATETRSDKRLENSRQLTSSQKAPLVPNIVTASIDIPSSYYVKVWKELNPPEKGAKDEKKPDAAELKKIEEETKLNIEKSVASIIPSAPGGQKSVTVTTFTELATPPLAGPSTAETATSWLGSNWQTIAMIGVALGSLVFLRGMINAAPPEPTPSAESAAALKIARTEDHEPDSRDESEAKKRTFRKSGPNLRAELTDLVKEDPDTAANILKAWIGEAA